MNCFFNCLSNLYMDDHLIDFEKSPKYMSSSFLSSLELKFIENKYFTHTHTSLYIYLFIYFRSPKVNERIWSTFARLFCQVDFYLFFVSLRR
jgi:hypothetical protein